MHVLRARDSCTWPTPLENTDYLTTGARCMVRRWWVVASTPDGRTSLWYSLTRWGVGWVRLLTLLGTTNMVILLAFDPCGGPEGHRGIPTSAWGRVRRGEGNCKSIYIRSRRAYNKSASTLCLFGRMATWRRATLQYITALKIINSGITPLIILMHLIIITYFQLPSYIILGWLVLLVLVITFVIIIIFI
jgi:hypothetical protein